MENVIFNISHENDVYFASALNLINTLDVENNIRHFPMIRDALYPTYAIAKRTIISRRSETSDDTHAKEFVEVFESLRDKYNNK